VEARGKDMNESLSNQIVRIAEFLVVVCLVLAKFVLTLIERS